MVASCPARTFLRALALGAEGSYIGRAFPYGLCSMGEAGVTKALEIIHRELDLTISFCGQTRIAKIDRGILLPLQSETLSDLDVSPVFT